MRFQLTPVSALEWDTRPQKTSILPSPTHTYTLHQMKDTKQDLMHTCPPWLHLRGKRLKSQFRGTQTCAHIINGGVGSVWGSLAVCARLISHHLGNMEPWRSPSFTYRYQDSCSVLQESKTYITHTHTRNSRPNNQPPKDSRSRCIPRGAQIAHFMANFLSECISVVWESWFQILNPRCQDCLITYCQWHRFYLNIKMVFTSF